MLTDKQKFVQARLGDVKRKLSYHTISEMVSRRLPRTSTEREAERYLKKAETKRKRLRARMERVVEREYEACRKSLLFETPDKALKRVERFAALKL